MLFPVDRNSTFTFSAALAHAIIAPTMKYLVFLIAMAAGVHFIAIVSSLSPRLKRLAFAFMVVSFLFNSMASINFLSMEYYRGPVRGFEVTFADLIAWGLALGMMIRTPQKIVWKSRFTLILLLFFLYTIFSLVRAGNSILGWVAIWQLARMGALYWVTVNFFRTEDVSKQAIQSLVGAYIASGIILALNTFKQKYLDGIYRAWAFFDHSNTIPSFALIILCVLLVWLLYEKQASLIHFLLALVAALGTLFAIFTTGSETAATACDSLAIKTYSDWFLPSKEELSLLFTNLARTGKDTFLKEGYAYWSSSSFDAERAWAQGFSNGVQGRVEKSELLVVRAIRAF
ncbi:hypothetical protein SDC9_60194 [bioreactor metagenome]|uniref:Lcl C-terminal domain-containing protein n=1 Tax=bioreactor metagenome TaxID=1076179 RepID=A0A644XIA3_9ZZZZ